jgi:hypothetical protein
MAKNLLTTYPGKVNPSTPQYPYGEPKNVNVNGDGTGTPFEAELVKDIAGFHQAILTEAGIVPSNIADNATNSQYLEGLKRIVKQANVITSDLIYNLNNNYSTGVAIQTTGFSVNGDGGEGLWLKTATTGTSSQTPDALGSPSLTDSNGNVWLLVYGNTIKIKSLGNSAVACEGVSNIKVDLQGQTVQALLASVNNQYFNGSLVLTGANADFSLQKNIVGENDYALTRSRTKSPVLNWEGKDVLWLGTSIPAQGGTNSYPDMFADTLNCNVSNLAFAGSHAQWVSTDDPFAIGTIKALSMTEADRQWGLTTYGPTSAYDDSFDAITKASQMTADHRIKAEFAKSNKDVVFLDHNHNDRRGDEGVLNPTKITVTGVTIGTTTQVEVTDASSLTVGNGAALEIVGITNLNYAAGRITSIVSNTVTIDYDSSSFTGTFVSGDLVELDRATVYGSWNFLIYYIKNMSVIYGDGDVKIILSSAPSEHTDTNVYDQYIYRIGRYIKNIADKWDLSFFDVEYLYDIKFHDHLTYFPDGVHPTTTESRQALANHWIEWAVGGVTKQVNSKDFLPSAGTPYKDSREALYSTAASGFETPDFIYTTGTQLVNDDFSGGLGDWTLSGTSPVVVGAPWVGGGSAVLCQGTDATNSTLDNFKAFGDDVEFSFDFQMPVVSGLIDQGDPLGTITICQCRVGGAYLQLQLIARPTSLNFRAVYFESPNTGLNNLPGIAYPFEVNTKYNIKVRLTKSTSDTNPNGKIVIEIDNVIVFSAGNLDTYNQNPINEFTLQSAMSNVDSFDCYFGNVIVNQLDANDYTQRFTGSFTAQGGETVTVVNGIITTVI